MSANEATSVRERREALGWTQPELAAAAGLSDETVRKAEQGRHVSPKSLRLIEEALMVGGRSDERDEERPSDRASSVRPNTVRLRTAALGVEIEATYSDSADREVAMKTITQALAELMRETGGSSGTGSGAAAGDPAD